MTPKRIMTRKRTDERGRAYKGSQLQIQIYINRRTEEFSRAVVQAIPEWRNKDVQVQWVSPLEQEGFKEYQDQSFLRILGLAQHQSTLRSFWPKGGPSWDALGLVEFTDRKEQGVLLVEAKSHVMEVYGSGCKAKEPARNQIRETLERTRQWCGAEDADWMGPLYQSANRLAHIYFFCELVGLRAWLIQVYFCDDPHVPTSATDWETALSGIKEELGLSNKSLPYLVEVKLAAQDRSELMVEY